MRRYRIKCVMASAVCLVLGLVIYIFLRSGTYIHSFLTENLNVVLHEIKFKTADNILNNFLGYYFVDFLWGCSLIFALCSVSTKACKSNVIKCSVYSFALGALFEVAQYFSYINGTYDFIDICMYAAASLVCVAININILLRR